MRLLTHALAVLYRSVGAVLGGAAKTAVLLLLACAVLFGVAVLHRAVRRHELRAVSRQMERAARPPGPHAAHVAADIHRHWHAIETAGSNEPGHCTRKDQTT